MVLSQIDNNISYPELKKINPNDEDLDANLYQIELKNVEVIIALGNPNRNYENYNIIYYPIYLVKLNLKVICIGLFEIKATDYNYYYDVNDELDLEKLDEPLLYGFCNTTFLNKMRLIPEKPLASYKTPEELIEESKKQDIEAQELEEIEEQITLKSKKSRQQVQKQKQKTYQEPYKLPREREDIFIINKGIPLPPLLNEENQAKAYSITAKYNENPNDLWIVKFMANNNYNIQDNEGGGDCFFAVIRDAFSSIGQQTTVQKIRKKLSDEADDQLFQNYREQYNMYNSALQRDTKRIKELEQEYLLLKQRFTSTISRQEQLLISNQANELKKEHTRLIEEKKITNQLLGEYKFMKNVNNLEQFKKKIRNSDYWADTWAISTLERILNIKFIILSSENYKEYDLKNVLQCGQLNDELLEQRGVFNPEFYIIFDYSGDHYKLISYKNKYIFKFSEIPYSMKELINDKCLERNAGPFALIPDFQEFKKSMEIKRKSKSPVNKVLKEPVYEELAESSVRGYYDDTIVFRFYIKAVDKPLPGKGSGEKIPAGRIKEFSQLATIPQWRKKLSNFWVQPFTLDGYRWASVEHYYQASKFKTDYPQFYLSFTLESGTELSKDPVMAKAAGSKTGKLKNQLLRPVEVVLPQNFENQLKKILLDALNAKFSQNEDLKTLLLATHSAKLMHFIRGDEPELCNELMIVRANLSR